MMQPDALRLADDLTKYLGGNTATQAASELRRLHAENFTLAAGQCVHATADEGGTPMCAEVERLQSARERDNVSFKQLLAQRDELLEALQALVKVTSWICENSYGDDMDAAFRQARAAIAKAQQLLEVTPAQMAHAEAIAKREQT
jgi:NADPH-dependent glutamate synthase beta subunit-like oxidoreductase